MIHSQLSRLDIPYQKPTCCNVDGFAGHNSPRLTFSLGFISEILDWTGRAHDVSLQAIHDSKSV